MKDFWFPGLVRKGTYKFTLVCTFVGPFVRSGPTALTIRFFFLFFAWSCVSIWLRWPPKIFFAEKFFDPQNGQKWSKFGHFWPKQPFLSVFGLYLPNAAINFHNFWYGNYPCGLLWENHSVYAGKILRWPKFGHLWPKFGRFLAKIDSFECFWPFSYKRCYESS